MKYIERIKMQVIIVFILEIIALSLLLYLGWSEVAIATAIAIGVNILLVIWIVFTMRKSKYEQDIQISRVLGNEAKEALDFGGVGVIIYDKNYEITWVSNYFDTKDQVFIGKKVTSLLPQMAALIEGEVNVVTGVMDGFVYEVRCKQESRVLFIKDVSKYEGLANRYKQESCVVGIVHLDNYMEVSAYEDESVMTAIHLGLRQPVVEWARKYGMAIRRLRSDRFILVLNEEIYQQILHDKFSILNDTRKKAHELELSISLSMAFAKGTTDLSLLDSMSNDLLELAQSRGGDQVAVKEYGGDVQYYGGNSEAVSKRSRVRVRVMSQAIKEAILESGQVFITGHKMMDFDCMGANIALSRLVQSLGKKAHIVNKSGGMEMYLDKAMHEFESTLSQRHHFISDEEATRLCRKNDLVIVADYHNPAHTNAPRLLSLMERVVVVDHHRRSENVIKNPVVIYIESGASSTCELLTECFDYINDSVDINEIEATFMYVGILVDTNRFMLRTGFRTFEAAANLKKMGVDPILAEDVLKEEFDDFSAKVNIMKYSQIIHENIIVACVNSQECLSKTLMSISADRMLAIKGIEAAFVIARTSQKETAISARSKGNVNVQRIMEEMHGGGHFTAAATQSQSETPSEMKQQLLAKIDAYLLEKENEDESNTTK